MRHNKQAHITIVVEINSIIGVFCVWPNSMTHPVAHAILINDITLEELALSESVLEAI